MRRSIGQGAPVAADIKAIAGFMPKFLRWSAYGLRTKGLIVVGLPLLPLAVFWLAVVLAVLRQPRAVNTEARTLSVQASLARVFSDLLDADGALATTC